MHPKRAFTLVETLATIAIIALLAAGVFAFVSNYRTWSRTSANKRTVNILNDGLSRYKQLAPDLAVLEASQAYVLNSAAHNAAVVAALRAGVADQYSAGLVHKFLSEGGSLDTSKLVSSGSGRDFWFSFYSGHDSETERSYYTTVPVGVPFTYNIPFVIPTPTFTSTNMPAWATLNESLGQVTGTAPSVQTATFDVKVTSPSDEKTYTLHVTIEAVLPVPAITSALAATAYVGSPFTYTITATYNPTSFNAVGLPNGLAVDTVTGMISGTPTTAGVSAVTISATNANGTGSATLTLTVIGGAPVITSAAEMTVAAGVPFTYTITASNSPTSYDLTGAPEGVTRSNAVVSGTLNTVGSYNVMLSATNAFGTGTKSLRIVVESPPVVAVDVVP